MASHAGSPRWLALALIGACLCSASLAAQRDRTGIQSPQAQGIPAPCAPGTVCADYDEAFYVFFGRVISVVPPPEDRSVGPMLHQVATFEVYEDFKGTAGGGATLTFDPNAEDARLFVPGDTMLVYARRVGPVLSFAGCSRTRRVTAEEPELATLRELKVGSRGGSLEGTLEIPESTRPPALSRGADLANVPVSIQAMDGSDTVVVTTQPSGYFLVPWLRPGPYRLRVESPQLAPIMIDVVIAERDRCQTAERLSAMPR